MTCQILLTILIELCKRDLIVIALLCSSGSQEANETFLDEILQNVPSPPSRCVQVRPSGRKLAGFGTGSAAELRIVFVRTVSCFHDQVTLREERVVLAIRVNENS